MRIGKGIGQGGRIASIGAKAGLLGRRGRNIGVFLWFLVIVGSFSGGSFPAAGYLKVSLSPNYCFLLCMGEKVVLQLVLLCVQGFEAFLLLLFSGLF